MSSVFFVMIFLVSFTRAASPPVVGPTENSTVTVHVGVILDFGSAVGMVRKTCIAMAIDDLNAIPGRRIRLVVHWRDSHGSETGAASAALNLIKSVQVKAIISPDASELADLLANMANQAHIPTFSFSAAISSSHTPAKSPYFITMAQNDSTQARAIAAVIKAYAWRAAILVHDDTLRRISLVPDLTDELQANGARLHRRLVIPFAASEVIIRDTLHKLAAMRTRIIIVHVSFPIGSRFFTLAHEMEMMEDGYVWVITSRLMNLFGYTNSSVIPLMQGVLGVKTYVPNSSALDDFRVRWKQRFEKEHPKIEISELEVYALWAYDAMQAIATAAERTSSGLNGSFHFAPSNSNMATDSNPVDLFDFGVSPIGPKLLQSIMGNTFTGLSGVIRFVDGQFQSPDFKIVNVVGKGERGIGYWTPASGLSRSMIMDKNYSANVEDLAGVIWPGGSTAIPNGQVKMSGSTKRLKIGVPKKNGFSEFMKVDFDKKNKRWNPTGFPIDVFNGVMKTMPNNVNYDFFPYENGHEDDAGYYDEVIYQVYLEKFDAVVGDTTIIANRSNYVEFTQPYVESDIAMIVPVKHEDGTNCPWWFLKPLTKEMWLTTIGLFLFKGILVWIFEHDKNPEFQGSFPQQAGKIISFCFSTLVFANREKLLSNYSRIVVNLWTFVVLILVTSFTANLTSILTVQKLQPSITDIESLIKNGECVGYQNGSFVLEFLKEQGFQDSKLKAYATKEDYADALSKGGCKDGVSAIVDEILYLKVALKNYCGKYTVAGRTYPTGGFGFVFQKGSAIVTDVSHAVLSFTEGNKMVDIEKRWFGDQTTCPDPLQTPATNTNIHLFPLYIVAGAASALALFVYIIYHVYGCRCQRGGDSKESSLSNDVGATAQVEMVQEHANNGETGLDPGERSEYSNAEGVSNTDGKRENDQLGPSNHPEAAITIISVSDIISEEEHHNVGGK
ncbi:glutamate receptor 2.9-like isoform X2 [Magnolia sinica]|uniref:glutamate receptor 2.9-like isoform X2 n=1 Tax=Magnolia sinica TaxID=86752 RepID=UPI002658574F|nr:glutamate receptor 2.9-like isoform X2 [Magnolia sinica]